jgi:hypothetical protein
MLVRRREAALQGHRIDRGRRHQSCSKLGSRLLGVRRLHANRGTRTTPIRLVGTRTNVPTRRGRARQTFGRPGSNRPSRSGGAPQRPRAEARAPAHQHARAAPRRGQGRGTYRIVRFTPSRGPGRLRPLLPSLPGVECQRCGSRAKSHNRFSVSTEPGKPALVACGPALRQVEAGLTTRSGGTPQPAAIPKLGDHSPAPPRPA